MCVLPCFCSFAVSATPHFQEHCCPLARAVLAEREVDIMVVAGFLRIFSDTDSFSTDNSELVASQNSL